ncbi:MAG: hypothetical protein A3C27_02675 [Candidatus Levybacteria bacterium RIFCSPHIGHO2_02_FULL_39_36]|nr:MAG: hypothetical protein UT20_C0019G0011 [Candidatus Levybacteria bacterium GW2011_GWA1_39_11]KKR25229.1 MAG: hypothetical protein UT56_C0002G0043 [Candidatus Levybacteria bacterium GW2011_GWB1_39_7]KKR27143.1 MAG: hypothetical protein UT57_C0016G0013 [Microgenomates group bacterium GW2011_GWC1_39_7]OGH15223.1 MAG: hypothetical protein A2689_02950 [Candidatus Levybacteria bacterium RIFCSPHIGHO2_01_FULL_38_96]OGH25920.1 MAG: hypothetical protein A3E68_00875 [Candidatus Levybacteria bacterium
MTKNNYWISPFDDGWKARREGTDRAAGVFHTQKQAEDFARNILQNNHDGELITQNQHGRIRSKYTIDSVDPNPPRDTEH